MARPELEVADIFRAAGDAVWRDLEPHLSPDQRKAVRAILACRTAALGGHLDACDACGQGLVSYNSCRNRHCPKCQAAARERWLEARRKDLLPVPYFHVVFTLPEQIARIALRNKRVLYALLFRASWETLQRVAADPKYLGADVGMLAVLHTWGQTLSHHPHLHCVVPGGGLSRDGSHWVPSRERFLLPVAVLSRVFRRRFLELLEEARASGALAFVGGVAALSSDWAWRRLMARLRATPWVVYAKRPFGGPDAVLSYLGRYTHKIAITNHRLVSHEAGVVRFRYRDYRDGDTEKELSLGEGEFIRRFLQHVLPGGFQRLRQYGILANSRRREALARARELLGARQPPEPEPEGVSEGGEGEAPGVETGRVCPSCGRGRLRRVEEIEPGDPLGIGARVERERALPEARAG